MRRILMSLFGIVFCALVLISAQGQTVASDGNLTIQPVSADADQMVNGAWMPVEVERIPDPNSSLGRAVNAGNDVCNMVSDNLPAFTRNDNTFLSSDATVINGYSFDAATDPDLATCIDNPYQSTQGYRTAWYRFTAPATGRLKISLNPNADYRDDYDTVVALYQTNSCNTVSLLTMTNCNDDANGLLSAIDTYVAQDQVYFIEIADRNLGIQTLARVNITVRLETEPTSETNASWNVITVGQPNAHRSRHSAVVINDEIYVFGGQTAVDDEESTRTATSAKFAPATGTWTPLAPMHENCDVDGYSNSGGAYVEIDASNRKVYFPSGFVGDDGTYAGAHCIYDVNTNTWTFNSTNIVPWSTGQPAIYGVVVERPGVGYLVAGGLNGKWLQASGTSGTQSVALAETHEYFADPETWTQVVRPNLNEARYAHTGMVGGPLRNMFCVVGGLQPSTSAISLLSDGECLDLNNASGTWTVIPGNNTPRFNAASYIDGDGNWYVFGGVDQTLKTVATTEKYDFATGTWTTLDDRYSISEPSRAWMRGGVVDGEVYLIGGETAIDGDGNGSVAGQVTKFVFDPPKASLGNQAYLPFIANRDILKTLSEQADPLWFNFVFSRNFDNPSDRFHVFELDLAATTDYKLTLSDIPHNPSGIVDDYDLLLLSETKVQLASGTNIGNNDEVLEGTLSPGKYYVLVVVKVNSPFETGDYQLFLEQN